MAITWQSVSAPNFNASNNLAVAAGNTITGGIDRLAQSAQGVADKQKASTHAEFQHNLLDLSMNPDLNKNEFLGKALQMSKANNLDPNQAMKQIESIRNVRNTAESLDGDQQLEYEGMQASLNGLQESGQQNIRAQLEAFDQRNPQVRQTSLDLNTFEAGGGLGSILNELYGSIEDTGDREKTSNTFNKVRQDYDNDFVVAQALQEVGLGEVGFLFDSSLLDSKKFKDSLTFHQKRMDTYQKNAESRTSLQNVLQQKLSSDIQTGRENLEKWHRDTKANNLKSFSF
ncbi:hypothetical protein NVP1152O_026 [Vibrio phage 1.152.O._10N.222.46.E1]|uniref:Uncharacterized protein n=4 Tax=Nahantvirus 49C7 TaxID=2846601 RepID=A0A2I7RBD0_9CAUD|nr:hypothetical protein NVP1025O_025 [Vibrio phage 1.025.O._10N.222.46.B6]AUR90758.1 hypothetical protein NVP1150O_025 [Vibrio phage 1.150.O._10N.222.46.A6]AUR90931.1 hypothetical protein NVP1152O_026 [Vibrio phage 1.152.O._10N.222.46.E1]AUS02399.1 hypothetical protein NVP2130O_025 [Vibrio phage 2.130.O._10N.222.46.C2]